MVRKRYKLNVCDVISSAWIFLIPLSLIYIVYTDMTIPLYYEWFMLAQFINGHFETDVMSIVPRGQHDRHSK